MTRNRIAVTLALVAPLLFAGCTEKPAGPSDDPTPTTNERGSRPGGSIAEEQATPVLLAENGARYHAYSAKGSVLADALYIGVSSPLDTDAVITFPLPEAAVALVAELRWTGDASDFELVLTTPRWCPGGLPVLGLVDAQREACWLTQSFTSEGPGVIHEERAPGTLGAATLRIQLDEDTFEAEGFGDWLAYAKNNVAVQSATEVHVSVFLDDPPADFSAFEEPSTQMPKV